MQAQQQVPQMLSLVQQITTRDGTMAADSKMVNCYPEQTENGAAAVKRPGLNLLGSSPAGRGQGIVMAGGNPVSLCGGKAYTAGTSTLISFTGTAPTATQPFHYVEMGKIFGATGAVIKQARALWVWQNANPPQWTFSSVTDANYPAFTMPGVANLDYTTYVMDNQGNIRGSNLNDPTTWPATNSLKVDIQLGNPIAIHRHLNYVVAFCDKGTQFYYDASNPTGSPLLQVQNATFRVGCVTGYSVAELNDTTFFIGKSSNSKGRGVFCFENMQLTEVGHPHVNKILNAATLVDDGENPYIRAFTLKTGGHSFYLINLIANNITLAYDVEGKHWHVWSSVVGGVEQYFVGVAGNEYSAYGYDSTNYIQDYSTGAVYTFSETAYQDYTGPINVRVVTHNYDWQTFRRKFFEALYLLADTVSSTIAVSYTDDDYATFSTARTIDLSRVKKFLARIGSSRRRAWQFLHTANTPLKVYGAEVPFRVEGQ